ncbi:MAG: hypothetical protein HKM89_11335, partial [Gemmatimonadales bacterium]|nr:hypothetical protein [Gemmatimonadales bacterium]
MFECRITLPAFLVLAQVGCAAQPGLPPFPGAPAPLTGELPTAALLEEEEARLPAVPRVEGPIALSVTYPTPAGRVAARDTSFIFGSVGTGDASLTINGYPVHVWPNGAWLAWMPFPSDSVMEFELIARTATDSVRLIHEARRATRFEAPDVGPWIDSNSISPRGSGWWPKDEPLTVSVRASEGSQVQVRLADGRRIPLVPDPRLSDVPWGLRAFDRDSANLRRRVVSDRYVGSIVGEAIARHLGPMVGPPPGEHRCPHMTEAGLACPMH